MYARCEYFNIHFKEFLCDRKINEFEDRKEIQNPWSIFMNQFKIQISFTMTEIYLKIMVQQAFIISI